MSHTRYKIHRFLPALLQLIIWIPTQLILKYRRHRKVYGNNHLRDAVQMSKKSRRGILVVSNHSAETDPVMVTASIPIAAYPVYYIAKPKGSYGFEGKFKLAVYGSWFFRIWGAYPTAYGLKDYEQALHYAIKILEGGGTLLYFPEGGISEEKLREAKGGLGYLLDRIDCIVLPVAIAGQSPHGKSKHLSLFFGEPHLSSRMINTTKRDADGELNVKAVAIRAFSLVTDLLVTHARAELRGEEIYYK